MLATCETKAPQVRESVLQGSTAKYFYDDKKHEEKNI